MGEVKVADATEAKLRIAARSIAGRLEEIITMLDEDEFDDMVTKLESIRVAAKLVQIAVADNLGAKKMFSEALQQSLSKQLKMFL